MPDAPKKRGRKMATGPDALRAMVSAGRASGVQTAATTPNSVKGNAGRSESGSLPANMPPFGRRTLFVPPSRTWEAANRNRQRKTQAPYAGLADNFLTGITLKHLREETRQACRRFTLAKAMLNRMADLCVADGFILQFESSNPGFNAMAKQLIEGWMRGPTVKGRGLSMTMLMRQLIHAWGTDGDMAFVYLTDGRIYPVESDRIVNPGGWMALDTEHCVAGIEMDEFGAPIKYWVQPRADALTTWNGMVGVSAIDAQDVYFVPNPVDYASGQTRGLPFMTAAVPLIEMLETYVESQANAALLATYMGLVFTTENGAHPMSELETDVTAAATQPSKEIQLEPGWSVSLQQGEKVEQMQPQYPQQSAKDFATLVGMLASASTGMPLILTLLDPTQATFHGFKSAISVCYKQITFMQENVMDVLRWMISRKLADAMRAGNLPMVKDWSKFTLIPPDMPTPEFGKDVDAAIRAVQSNLMTAEQATQRLGTGNWADIARKRASEAKYERDNGISPVIVGGTAQPQSGGDSPSTNAA
jgi:capsid protein